MGLHLSKPKPKQRVVDGGSSLCADDRKLAEPERVANVSSKPRRDYKVREVADLIRNRKLAPFYEGLAECKEDGDEIDESKDVVATIAAHSPKSPLIVTSNPSTAPFSDAKERKKKKKNIFMVIKRRLLLHLEHDERELPTHSIVDLDISWLKECLIECPICFLSFPRNINWTSCCHQPICTFCFLHIRRPPSGREITCPFCNAEKFTVRYVCPEVMREQNLTRIPNKEGLPKEASRVMLENIRMVLPPPEPRLRYHTITPQGGSTYYHHQRQYSNYYPGGTIQSSATGAGTGQSHSRRYTSFGNQESLFYMPGLTPPFVNFLM